MNPIDPVVVLVSVLCLALLIGLVRYGPGAALNLFLDGVRLAGAALAAMVLSALVIVSMVGLLAAALVGLLLCLTLALLVVLVLAWTLPLLIFGMLVTFAGMECLP